MTENEKLRVLLAEARDAMRCGCYIDCPIEDEPSFYERIDAALAEPVLPEYIFRGGYVEDASGDRWWSAELLTKTEHERDEARAEAKALREVIKTAGNRLRACGEQLTEHSYQEMASVLFDLPQATEGEP